MGFKRLIRKGLLGGAGALIEGHIIDAIQKKKQTGKTFRECLEESVKETVSEDLPGTSHVYQMGKIDGRVEGTVEQANRDEKKIQDLHEQHERDIEKMRDINSNKDRLIEELLGQK